MMSFWVIISTLIFKKWLENGKNVKQSDIYAALKRISRNSGHKTWKEFENRRHNWLEPNGEEGEIGIFHNY